MAKNNDKETQVASYSKRALIESSAYEDKRDILSAILSDDYSYTIEEVNTMIDEFLHKEV